MSEHQPRPTSDTYHPKPGSTGSGNPNKPPSTPPPKVDTAPKPNKGK